MSSSLPTVAVVGAGSWGTALALLFARNGCAVRLWCRSAQQQTAMTTDGENARYLPGHPFPSNLIVSTTLSEAVAEAAVIVLAVPSAAIMKVVEQIQETVSHPRMLITAKGIESSSQQLLFSSIQTVFEDRAQLAVLSGPSFADEVAAGKPTAISLACQSASLMADLLGMLHSKTFRVYPSEDMVGVSVCGAMKNVLAIAVGIADGLAMGANTRAALITRGLSEMGRLCEAMGGVATTLLSLAGVGDLVLTCTDDQSRNRRFGKAIGAGASVDEAVNLIGQAIEGFDNLRHIHALAKHYQLDMPITAQLVAILYNKVPVHQAVDALLSRQVSLA